MPEALQRVSSSFVRGRCHTTRSIRPQLRVGGRMFSFDRPQRAVGPAVKPCKKQSKQQTTPKRR